MSCGVDGRRSSDPALWLWCRLAATAPTRPLAQPEMAKKKKKEQNTHTHKLKNYHMIQQSHSWASIQITPKFEKIYTCIPLFIIALFTIAKAWTQPKCPLTEDWINKMWYIHTMEFYSVIKKNKIMPFAATWVGLEIIILSEMSKIYII